LPGYRPVLGVPAANAAPPRVVHPCPTPAGAGAPAGAARSGEAAAERTWTASDRWRRSCRRCEHANCGIEAPRRRVSVPWAARRNARAAGASRAPLAAVQRGTKGRGPHLRRAAETRGAAAARGTEFSVCIATCWPGFPHRRRTAGETVGTSFFAEAAAMRDGPRGISSRPPGPCRAPALRRSLARPRPRLGRARDRSPAASCAARACAAWRPPAAWWCTRWCCCRWWTTTTAWPRRVAKPHALHPYALCRSRAAARVQDTRKRVVGILLGEVHKGRLDVTNSYAGARPDQATWLGCRRLTPPAAAAAQCRSRRTTATRPSGSWITRTTSRCIACAGASTVRVCARASPRAPC
jgi:hypothetical protein